MAEQTKPVIRFRNYKPSDQSLVEKGVAQVLPQPALPSAAIKEQEQADIAKLLAAPVDSAVAALPKKANWDLKRDIEGRMAKLDRQTQRSIAEIVRDKVRTQQQAVAVHALPAPTSAAVSTSTAGVAPSLSTSTDLSAAAASSATSSASASLLTEPSASASAFPASATVASDADSAVYASEADSGVGGVGRGVASNRSAHNSSDGSVGAKKDLDEQFDFSAAGIDPAALMQAMATAGAGLPALSAAQAGASDAAAAAPAAKSGGEEPTPIAARTRRGLAKTLPPPQQADSGTPSPAASGGRGSGSRASSRGKKA